MYINLWNKLFASVFLGILSSISLGAAPTIMVNDSFNQYLQDTSSHVPHLGTGYDSTNDAFRNQCINGTASFLPRSLSYIFPLTDFEYGFDPTFFVGVDRRNFQDQGNYAYDYFSVVAARPYAFSQGVGNKMTLGNQDFQPSDPRLNELGTASYATNLDEFYRACGDMLVAQREIGAGTVSSIQIHFANHNEKDAFKSQLKNAAAPKIDEIAQAISDTGIDGVVVVRPLQLGGDPKQLLILKNKLGQVIQPIAICPFSDIQPCRDLIAAWDDYLQSDNLSEQVIISSNISDVANYDGPSVRGAILMDYSSVGLLIDRKLDAARRSLNIELPGLAKQVAGLAADIDRVEILLGYFSERLTQQQSTALVKLHEDLIGNRSVLKSLGLGCYVAPATCSQNIQSATLLPIDRNLLELPPKPTATPSTNPNNTDVLPGTSSSTGANSSTVAPAATPSTSGDSQSTGGSGALHPVTLIMLLAIFLFSPLGRLNRLMSKAVVTKSQRSDFTV